MSKNNLKGFDVLQATANTRLVGTMGAHFLKFLHETFHLDLYHVHMIGHSLGAHAAGYAGADLRKRGRTLGRITGEGQQ